MYLQQFIQYLFVQLVCNFPKIDVIASLHCWNEVKCYTENPIMNFIFVVFPQIVFLNDRVMAEQFNKENMEKILQTDLDNAREEISKLLFPVYAGKF